MAIQRTDRRILDFIRYSDGVDRRELARDLSLPPSTVVSSVKRLLAGGELVAVDAEQGRATRGRGRHPLRMAGPERLIGLIRWRGRQLRVAIHSTQQQQLFAAEQPVPAPGSGPAGLSPAVEALVVAAAGLAGVLDTVVISVPAPFLRGSGAPREHSTLPDLPAGFPLIDPADFDSVLADRFGLRVITENNANLAALGEQHSRSGVDNFIYLKLGYDGIGSAVVSNGQLVRGAHGYGGELAHLQIDRTGRLCHCGGRGCLWMAIRELTLPNTTVDDGDPINLAPLTRHADEHDPGAHRMLADIGRLLGRSLGHLSTVLDPERIIVDSTLGTAVEHVLAGIGESFGVEAPPVIARNVAIVAGLSGEDAELCGALEIPRELARRP